jgi:hypothetical protein
MNPLKIQLIRRFTPSLTIFCLGQPQTALSPLIKRSKNDYTRVMKNISLIILGGLVISTLYSCGLYQLKTAERSELTPETDRVTIKREGTIKKDTGAIPEHDLKKYAFELGFNPDNELSDEERAQILARYKVRALERTLDSDKERQHYSKVLPYLVSDQEKADYLSNPTIEGRQAWVIRNKIWSRAKSDKDFLEVVESQDLTLGMNQELVRKSWGEPESVEFSGNPVYKNEKWRYIRDVPSPNGYKRERRYVFFEGGRVVGWETN